MKDKFKVVHRRAYIESKNETISINTTKEFDIAFEIFLNKKLYKVFNYLDFYTSHCRKNFKEEIFLSVLQEKFQMAKSFTIA